MKSSFLSALVLILTLTSTAQETPENESKFMVGLNFSGNYSYRTLDINEDVWTSGIVSTEFIVDNRNKFETPTFGFSAGVTAQYLLSKRFEISLDAQYLETGYSRKDIPITTVDNPEGVGFISGRYIYSSLQLPVRLNYKLVNKRIHVYITGGIAPSTLLSQRVKLKAEYNDGSSETITEDDSILYINKLAFSSILGIGVGFHLADNIVLRIEPIARYSLTTLVTDTAIEEYHYSLGCQFQVSLKL